MKDDAAYKIVYNDYIQTSRIRNLDVAECTMAPVTCVLNAKDFSGKHQKVQI